MSTVDRSRRATGHRSTGHRSTGPSSRPRGRIARWLAAPGWVVLMLACIAIVSITSRYLTFNPEVYFPEQVQVYLRHEFALGVHVLSGVLALLIGPWQFVGRLRRRFISLHRYLGAAYVGSATGLGVSGLFLAPTAYTGVGASIAFTVLDLTMLFTTWTAVRMVAAHRYGEHRRWMIRSFSLILAGVMLRVWIPTYYVLAGTGIVHFSFETAYAVVAWLAWVPNLLIAIWVTRRPAPMANAA